MTSVVITSFESALAGQNGRVVRIPHPSVTFLAQNMNGRAALLARVELEPGQVVPDGRGFLATAERSGGASYLRILSAETGVSLLFLKLVDYVLERTSEARDPREAGKLVVLALDEFKRFTQRRAGLLTENEIRGLVAELNLVLLLQGGDPTRTRDVFDAWGGPFGSLHDFAFAAGNAIEVKSAHRPAREIRVTSPAQVSPLPDGLDLLVLPMEKVASAQDADVSFLQLLREVGALASSHGGDVAEVWDAALEALAIDLEDQYYARWHFALGDWLRFVVSEDFPRIREDDIPQGVQKVSFSLGIESLAPFSRDLDPSGGMWWL